MVTVNSIPVEGDSERLAQAIRDESLEPGNILGISAEAVVDEFERFVGCYDLTNPGIEYKRSHTYRVALLALRIAREENRMWQPDRHLDEGMCLLAGLLHDTGRFPQWAMVQSYSDAALVPHARISHDMLSGYGMIRRFVNPDAGSRAMTQARARATHAVLEAVRTHSDFSVEDLSEDVIPYAYVTRDADKVDILNATAGTLCSEGFLDRAAAAAEAAERGLPLPPIDPVEAPFILERVNLRHAAPGVSDAVYEDVMSHRIIRRDHSSTLEDGLMCALCLVFDYGKVTRNRLIRESGAVSRLAEVADFLYAGANRHADRRFLECVEEVRSFLDT